MKEISLKNKLNLWLASLCTIVLFWACSKAEQTENKAEQASEKPEFALVIHGGAGTILKANMTDEMEAAYREALQASLDAGYAILERGGTSVEAVRAAIHVMEDSPLFNAGKGAVFNSLGKHELDASIMEGHSLNAGAVAGVQRIKNPIDAAILVKDSTRHVMLSGAGAEEFAAQFEVAMEEESYFFTEKRYQQLLKAQGRESVDLDHSAFNAEGIDNHKFGTVGCVALDKSGNIAAGTSTGGMTNKKYGRIGDSPIIGAGNYANNASCGVSCTGTGEYFMRTLAAHEASDLMLFKKLSIDQALNNVIQQIDQLGGDGGMIALDAQGNVAWDFNTEGMYRGYRKSTGESSIEIYEQQGE